MQIGVDIGGTFTDIVALGDDGRLHLTKVPTTMAFGGTDPETGRPFVASELAAGGMGARPAKDGIHVVETDVTNCMNIPVEALEMNFPLRVTRTGPVQ